MLLDKYPNCIGCPVFKYCGTVVASTLLCATDNIGMVGTKKPVHLTHKQGKLAITASS